MKKETEKLRTLKDLNRGVDNDWNDYVHIEELKAEAVKWIKEYEKRFEVESQDIYADDFIKHFFNLTEEDLK